MAGALFGFDCLWSWWLGSSAAMRRHVDCRGTQHPMQSCKANLFRNGKDKLFSSTARSPVMAVVMRLWEERRGEEMFARRRGVFAKEESLDSRLSTCEYRISSAAGTSTLDQREG